MQQTPGNGQNGSNWRNLSRMNKRQTVVAIGSLALLAILGALVLRAGASLGGASPQAQSGGPLIFGAAQASTPTATPIPPTPTPTDTPIPAATATALPTPTATPIPTDPVTFTCASAHSGAPSNPTLFFGAICIQTDANRAVTVAVNVCNAGVNQYVTMTAKADGTQSSTWQFSTNCAMPFSVVLTAHQSDGQTPHLAGSSTFTVSS